MPEGVDLPSHWQVRNIEMGVEEVESMFRLSYHHVETRQGFVMLHESSTYEFKSIGTNQVLY